MPLCLSKVHMHVLCSLFRSHLNYSSMNCCIFYQFLTIARYISPLVVCFLFFPPHHLQFAELDLSEAIRDLDNYTAALHGDFSPADRKSKARTNADSRYFFSTCRDCFYIHSSVAVLCSNMQDIMLLHQNKNIREVFCCIFFFVVASFAVLYFLLHLPF